MERREMWESLGCLPTPRVILGLRMPMALGGSSRQNLNDWRTLSRGQFGSVCLFSKYLLTLSYVPSTELGIRDAGMSKT